VGVPGAVAHESALQCEVKAGNCALADCSRQWLRIIGYRWLTCFRCSVDATTRAVQLLAGQYKAGGCDSCYVASNRGVAPTEADYNSSSSTDGGSCGCSNDMEEGAAVLGLAAAVEAAGLTVWGCELHRWILQNLLVTASAGVCRLTLRKHAALACGTL
jgi:hypothetical protein